MRHLLTMTCCCLVLAAAPAHADPGPTVKYLIDDAVSSFTLGMLRIELRLDELYRNSPGIAFVDYDWDKNRILLIFTAPLGIEPTKENCREAINKLRTQGGVNPNTGQLLLADGSFYSAGFRPIGYEQKKEPKNLRNEIDEIIEVHAFLGGGSGEKVSCQGALLSNTILFEAEPPPVRR
jgi:hypothetical protein